MRNNIVRNTVSLIFLALTVLACNSPSGISGKIDEVENTNQKIYLIQPGTLHDVAASYFGKVIDSALVNSDGNFTFSHLPKTTEPVLLELAIQQTGKLPNYLQNDDPSKANYMPVVWKSDESIIVTASLSEFQKSFSIEAPSEVNKALLDLKEINQNAYETYLKGKNWELKEGNQLMDKEHALLQYQTELMKFANNTPHLLPALVALRWVSPISDYERVPEFLVNQCTKWSEKRPEHPWATELCNQSQPENLPVLLGAIFPDLLLPMITKDTLSLTSQLGSKLTIIDLWASWCGPCRIENRDVLVPIWEKYHDNGLQIIGISLEGNESGWKAATEMDGADRWLQASELDGDDTPILRRIRVRTIPANFILDKKGVVIAKNVHGQALIDWVKNYLREN